MQNGTKYTESSELHRYPAVDTCRKRKLRDDNITENVSWRVHIWYHTVRVSILLSIHRDYIDLEYNIACIRIQFSDKTVTEIRLLDSLHLSQNIWSCLSNANNRIPSDISNRLQPPNHPVSITKSTNYYIFQLHAQILQNLLKYFRERDIRTLLFPVRNNLPFRL